MLSKEEVLRIAELAKIEIKEEDMEKYQKDLSAILDFVGTLSKLPDVDTDEHRQMMGLESVLREDVYNEGGIPRGQELLEQAPEKKGGFVLSPRILKTDAE